MLISNFNLCKSEWLELVFAKRNKEYGAYYIRQQHPTIVLKSLAIGVFSVVVVVGVVSALTKVKPITDIIVPVTLDHTVYKIPPATKPDAPKPKPKIQAQKPAATQAAAPIITTKFPPPVVAPDPIAVEPPKIDDIKGAVGQVDIKNGAAGSNASDSPDKGSGVSGVGDASGSEIFKMVENMPQPVGGEAAWAKFLQSNLRYTEKAMENEISGKVYVSFIVEADGHISSIKVERGPGYGLDEEAVRVLKLAKPWKPGIQNGRPVRVQLTLPVNFTLGN